ncbi:hypothetical protein [Calorimonas adulescens]|uniref:Uncharacterized protein n=1 Tax=Calorimonas adulescens TaxID=2606906 RepID=A0A5D8QAV6_9THEO|nr:hypothetical protein [Calorimonas adulescens]TZE80916.1 hypothetical protein FWJ32_11535 [Calorimonas adulescens]
MYDKEKKIQEIINFVNDHRESMASQIVGRRMLGDGTLTSNERLEELKNALFNASEDEIDSLYYIVK